MPLAEGDPNIRRTNKAQKKDHMDGDDKAKRRMDSIDLSTERDKLRKMLSSNAECRNFAN